MKQAVYLVVAADARRARDLAYFAKWLRATYLSFTNGAQLNSPVGPLFVSISLTIFTFGILYAYQ